MLFGPDDRSNVGQTGGLTLSGLGHSKDFEPEILEIKLKLGDVVLAGTDGWYLNVNAQKLVEMYGGMPVTLAGTAPISALLDQQNKDLAKLAQKGGGAGTFEDDYSIVSCIYG
jgi:serine/threonine protein phosphatase PrpC